MKKIFTFFLTLIVAIGTLRASNTQVDGIWYDFDTNTMTATVTYRGSYSYSYEGEYSGTVVIPSFVMYKGTNYSVTSIREHAFYNCSDLTSLTISNSVTSIGVAACRGCSSLATLTIGNSVTTIGNVAFAECSSLTSVIIPNSVTSIESSAFSGCSSLTSVTISNSMTSIESSTFSSCSSLTSVTIPNSMTSIESLAFSFCSSLTSVTIPNSVTRIEFNAFEGCKSLATMMFKGVNPPNGCGIVIDNSDSTKDSATPICYVPCGSLESYASKFHNYMMQFVEQSSYSIDINTSNNTYGIAKVASRPDCNSAIVTAIPNEGCTFVKWSDGNTQATRYLELTEDISLTAYFAKEGYTIHVYQDCNTTIE